MRDGWPRHHDGTKNEQETIYENMNGLDTVIIRQMSDIHSQELNDLDIEVIVQMQLQYIHNTDGIVVQT